mgnify:CR=1 FL=1
MQKSNKFRQKAGQIVIPSGTSPWPHELRIAVILSNAGYRVEFIHEYNSAKTADFLLNGVPYELKSPKSSKIDAVERNLKRATKQSRNIVFDSSRMKNLRDDKIRGNLIFQAKHQKLIDNIIFIDKHGRINILTSD